jgi:hypothetical protein
MMAQHPQEFEPFIICRQSHPQTTAGVSGDLANQQSSRKDTAIT